MPLDTILQHFAPSGPEALSLLLTPGSDVAYIGITPFALAKRLGIPVRIIAVAQRLGVAHGVVVKEHKAPKKSRSGKNGDPLILGTIAGSTGHQIASDWAFQKRLRVRFVYLSPGQQLHAYRSGFIDGIACWEPFLTKAKRLGGLLVCDANSINHPMFNVICATDKALTTKSRMLRRFLEANAQISSELASGAPLDGLDNLPWLYGNSLDLGLDELRSMVNNGYKWPVGTLSSTDYDALRESLTASNIFLHRNGFAGEPNSSNDVFGVPLDQAGPPGTLNVHCSDSFMCTAYHLAVIRGEFKRSGFRISIQSLSRGQRVALLNSEESRKEIVSLEARALEDPIGAMADCRRISEHLLRQVYCTLRADTPSTAKENATKTIDKLDSYGCFQDQSILAAAHNLRVAGNWAIHYVALDTIAPEDLISRAKDCVGLLLRVREWRDRDAAILMEQSRICASCENLIGREDKCCPFCGFEHPVACKSCGRQIRSGWRNCPECGSLLSQRLSVQPKI